jgi:hypothetical protein
VIPLKVVVLIAALMLVFSGCMTANIVIDKRLRGQETDPEVSPTQQEKV